ncbi:MAG: recombinase family protein [Kiritimatiellae bacterium]|nr:recombinase family protein [Kiritimatiellia bacterium]
MNATEDSMSEQRKAVAYLRVSGLGQAGEDRGGLDRQREKVAAYASARGLAVEAWFEDLGVSGTRELDDRPGLSALVERVRGNGIRVVLVERLDRLARDLVVQELLLRDLEEVGVRVETADEGAVDRDDPTRTLIRQVLGAVAEYDRKMVVLKLRAARQRKRRREGRCEGRKFYGEKPGETAVLEAIATLRSTGASWAAVAAELNARGLRNRFGRPWTRSRACQAFLAARRARRPGRAR